MKAATQIQSRLTCMRAALLAATALIGLTGPSQAQTPENHSFKIGPQPLSTGFVQFSQTTGIDVFFNGTLPAGLRTSGVTGTVSPSTALSQLLQGTGLSFRFRDDKTVTIVDPGTTAAVPAEDGTTVLQPITVTGTGGTLPGAYATTSSSVGTKTDTPLRDVPQSIQVVPRSVITDRQITSLTEALQSVSNVTQTSTAGNRAETFTTRGFATQGYAIDGIMLNPTLSRPETSLDLANVERVEVLKGPASVLYGRGDPGGLINVVTRKPTETLTGEASTQVGSFGFRRTEASVSGPLNSDGTLTARLTGAAQTDDGFVDERDPSKRQFLGGVLQWAPDEDTKVTLSVDHTHQNQPFDRGLVVSPDNEIHLPPERFLAEDWSKVDSRKTRTALSAEHQVNDWLQLRGTVRYDNAYTHDTGIDPRDLLADGRTLRRRYTDRIEDMENLSAQFEAVSTFDTGFASHTLLTGVEYVKSQMDFWSARANIASIDIYDPVYGAIMPVPVLNNDFVQDVHTVSGYIQDQIELSPQWKMLAGLRYDHVEQDLVNYDGSRDPAISEGRLTGRFGLVYQPIEPVSLYASYSTSFKPQAGMDISGAALAPQEGWQVEAGAKVEFIPDALSATMSVFQITKSNVATSDPANPGADYSLLTGEQRSRGAEIDVTGEILPGWQVIGSLGYVDAKITKDETFTVGNELVGVPHWSGSLWTTYEFQADRFDGLKLGVGVTAVGRRMGDLDNSFSVDGYYRVDASASYKITENLDFSIVGRNLLDKEYIESTASRTENYPGAPRSVFATLKASF